MFCVFEVGDLLDSVKFISSFILWNILEMSSLCKGFGEIIVKKEKYAIMSNVGFPEKREYLQEERRKGIEKLEEKT